MLRAMGSLLAERVEERTTGPLDADFLNALFRRAPGRGWVVTPRLSIFNSRHGYVLVAGRDGADDSDDSFTILKLSSRSSVIRVIATFIGEFE